MADYCTKCGSYRSETALEQCVCDAIICAICMVNEPIHMKHQRDHERRERAKIVIAKDAEIKRLRQSLRSVRMLAARMQRSGVEDAEHLIRFCAEAGVVANVLRDGEL